MSVMYGGAPGGAGYQPAGRVNFGWIGESFELFKANIGVWIVAGLMSLVPVVISFIIGAAYGASAALHPSSSATPTFGGSSGFGGTNMFTGGLPPGLSALIRIVSAVYTAWLYGGVYRTAVKQVRGEPISTGDIFSGGPLMLKMLGFNIVYGLAVGIGTLLCIVPGLLLAGLLIPGFALIADGETVGNAISRSIDAMKRDMWNAAAFALVIGLVVIASAILCGLGLFVTVPMFYLTGALAYRDMIGMPGVNPAAPAYGTAAPGVWPPPPNAEPQAAPPPPQWGSTPPQYPSTPPQQYPSVPPRQSLSGEPIDTPGQTPPEQGE
jgi:uncharacterized membrane protein